MSKKTKLIPELRFPEFSDEGEWEEKELNSLGELINGLTYSPNDVRGKGLLVLRSSNIQNGLIALNDCVYVRTDIKGANFSEPNDILICIRNGSKSLIGKNAIIPKGIPFATHGAFMTVFRAEKPEFVFQLFQTERYEKQVKADLGATINSINSKNFLKYKFIVPKNPEEKQKIASCLSSLDEVIAAESQKLDLLKYHKKGLMQKLFPQEGEKVPKYRFKEFEKDGEWNLKEFSNYIKLYRGSSPRPIQNYLTQDKNGVNWIKIGDTKNAINSTIYKVEERITLKGAQKSRKVKTGELILANSMSFGKTYELAINGYIYDGWFVLREYENHYYKPFLLQLLNSDYMQRQYQKLSAGGIVQNISSEIVYKTILFHTSFREQQKIASCLSSLDTLITAQTEKIEQLKLHKKGLMQGLFPKIND